MGSLYSFSLHTGFVTDRVSGKGDAICRVRLSIRLFPLYLLNRLTFELEILYECGLRL